MWPVDVNYRLFSIGNTVKIFVTSVPDSCSLYDFAGIPARSAEEADNFNYLNIRMQTVAEIGGPVPNVRANQVVLAENMEGKH